jgi:hypothetical protein
MFHRLKKVGWKGKRVVVKLVEGCESVLEGTEGVLVRIDVMLLAGLVKSTHSSSHQQDHPR